MPTYITLLFVLLSAALPGQEVIDITEVLEVSAVTEQDGQVRLLLPLALPHQRILSLTTSAAGEEIQTVSQRGYQWDLGRVRTDTVRVDYRILLTPDSVDGPRQPGQYALPPRPPRFAQSGLSRTVWEPGDTLATINRITKRLARRVKATDRPERFDYGQSLLQDYHQRLSTTDRRHLLLSFALQEHGITHRLVAGKWLTDGLVFENQLWVEAYVQQQWVRLVLLPKSISNAITNEGATITYLVCTYDWRDATLSGRGATGQPLAVPYASNFSNVLDYFWYQHGEAMEAGTYDRAISYMDSVLAYQPSDPAAVGEKGILYTQAGNPQEGLRYLQYGLASAESKADSATALVHFAKYYTLMGNLDRAYETIVRANELGTLPLEVFYDPRLSALLNNRKYIRQLNALELE